MKEIIKSDRVTVYLQNARVLPEDERLKLPQDKRAAAESSGKEGIWIEVNCPKGACTTDGGTITLPADVVGAEKEKKGIWLNLFCPDDQCVIEQNTDLP
jgi:hypothetical protein